MAIKPSVRVGPPTGFKITGSQRGVEVRAEEYDRTVAHHGMRVWWSRALRCPCYANAQTTQPDPVCPICRGRGWQWVLPDPNLFSGGTDYDGNAVEISPDGKSVAIRAILTAMTVDPQVYEKFGAWVFGTCNVTVSRRNRLSYFDRITQRDGTISFSHLIECDGRPSIRVLGQRTAAGLWAPVAEVVYLRSLDRDYHVGDDFTVNDFGEIVWIGSPPGQGTHLTLLAHFRPRLIVTEYGLPLRAAMVQRKKPPGDEAAQYEPLAGRWFAKLEFLAEAE
jgi:hypothetical protein